MDFIKKAMELIKSPLGSIACRAIVILAKMGISWTPTKTDDYYLAKTAYEIIEGQCYAKELIGLTLTDAEQRNRIAAKENMEYAYKAMIDYKKSKKKK